jgi:hypothetical protein
MCAADEIGSQPGCLVRTTAGPQGGFIHNFGFFLLERQ